MKNYLHRGEEQSYTVPANTTLTSGQAILVGNLLGIVFSTNNNTATASGANGDIVTLAMYGVFSLPKVAGAGTGFIQGQPVYWDLSAQAVTGLNGSVNKAATSAFTVTTGAAANDTLNELTVGSTELLAATITFAADSATQTAAAIVAGVNANSVISGYTASNVAGVVTLTGPASLGSGLNGIVPVLVSATAVALVIGTPSAFAGGVAGTVGVAATSTASVTTAAVDGDILPGIVINGTQLLASALFFNNSSYTTTQTAAAIVQAINNNTVNSGYSATNASAVITITGPLSLGGTINTLVAAFAATSGTGTMVVGTPTAFTGGVNSVTSFPIGYGWDQPALYSDTVASVKLKNS